MSNFSFKEEAIKGVTLGVRRTLEFINTMDFCSSLVSTLNKISHKADDFNNYEVMTLQSIHTEN